MRKMKYNKVDDMKNGLRFSQIGSMLKLNGGKSSDTINKSRIP